MAKIFFVSLLVYTILARISADDEPEGIGDEGGEPEKIYNKTYREYHTGLEIAIFNQYSSARRPVRDPSKTTEVSVQFDVHHISVNQKEQTMTIHGQFFSRWNDEFLGWDPKEFKGIERISSPKWKVWHPKLRVANSVSGVFSTHEISSYAHTYITTYGKEEAIITMYPSFSVKVGCSLDFSSFPRDYHTCTVSFFTRYTLKEVRLSLIPGTEPQINIGWGSQENKRIISDFEIVNISDKLAYYVDGQISMNKPNSSQTAKSWSVVLLTVEFRRHNAMFGIGTTLPCLILAVFNILPFFLPSIQYAVYILVTNVIMQAIFLHKIINSIPLSARKLPNPVVFYSMTMWSNMIALVLHIALVIVEQKTSSSYLRSLLNRLGTAIAEQLPQQPKTPISALRAALGMIFFLLYFLLATAFLMF
ncbi:hypothetical protein Q1695_014777 [Nippostrongylus brasiliensis]|nr:hypothetical protein Q1695_014777 [Nippostrongylus brasiliensis]